MIKTVLTLVAMLSLSIASNAESQKFLVNKNKNGLALQGYDPVAYFTDNKPVKGNASYKSSFEGAFYHFSSAGHKAMFDADPIKYAPAYGGYCGYAASINRLSPISPDWFQIEDGKLILQHNKKAFDKFNADLKGNIAKADENWPGLVEEKGVLGGKNLVNVDRRGVALGGYDPVSYFTGGKPMKGDSKIEGTYNGALYHFTSEDHRAMFEDNPTHYAPAYGGYCGYAASLGKVRPANPTIWSIVEGHLILQHTKGSADLWAKDVTGNKAKADKYWPLLVAAKAGTRDPVDGLFGKSVLDLANIK
jgi:YHS domain-containing protein